MTPAQLALLLNMARYHLEGLDARNIEFRELYALIRAVEREAVPTTPSAEAAGGEG